MRLRVLGSAAGGGFPQWNANGPGCRLARAGDPRARSRTQTSLAASADDRSWVVINASPDIRQQIEAYEKLHPAEGVRSSPIKAVILTSAEIDAVAGLLSLRERQPFALYATPAVLDLLAANPIFDALDPTLVVRRALSMDVDIRLEDAVGEPLGLHLRALDLGGGPPLYAPHAPNRPGFVIGIAIHHAGRRAHIVPSCPRYTPDLDQWLADSDLLFFDGTLFRDDEMAVTGSGQRTGRQMGHMAVGGPDGVLARVTPRSVRERVLIHINNTNPILIADSPERAAVLNAGWAVAEDGQEFRL